VANIYDDIAKDQDEADNSIDTDEPATEGTDIKSVDEIMKMQKKSEIIEYAESIGLSGLSTDLKVDELKQKVIQYQNDTYAD
jgi:hypothetical protein